MDRRRVLTRFLRSTAGMLSLVVLLIFIGIAVFGPRLAPYDPVDQDLLQVRQSPSAGHLLGTDELGRDVLSRLIVGSRASLIVASVSTLGSLVVALPLGMLSGLAGRWVDMVLMRIVDGLLSFPTLLLALAISAIMRPGVASATIAIAVVFVPRFTRFVRGQTLAVREQVYVEAARSTGASTLRLMFRHILPNIISPVIVRASISTATAILIESALSFIGAGIQPPDPSWGNMLRTGMAYVDTAWWLTVVPGITISVLVLATNLLGDSLRDALEPRFRM